MYVFYYANYWPGSVIPVFFLLLIGIKVRSWVPWERSGCFRALKLGKFIVKVYPRSYVPEFSLVIRKQPNGQILLNGLVCQFSLWSPTSNPTG